ncbi:MAG: response regulator, partial [Candidatus Eisenbacteria bacterium]|nr:response regulator [Candidatus Eisenbacteria bacterium]
MEKKQNKNNPTASARILVVEDEKSLRTILRLQLDKAGYEVITASDGEEGVQRALEAVPDLIVMDWMMPKMDGNKACQILKNNFTTSHIPVIMLTAKSELKDRLEGLSGGANDYIVKPYEADELLLRVHNLLVWSRSQREASPLTGLPGNAAIEDEFQNRLDNNEVFAFLYLDIDNFKAFNDYYGYRHGDQAIRLLADIVVRVVAQHGEPGDFIGHVGGDDFIVIAGIHTAQIVGEALIEAFDREIQQLYDQEDRTRGFIKVVDRRGSYQQFPIMTLTIAAVTNQGRQFKHVGEITDTSAELKHVGKGHAGSIVVWERR